MICSLLTTPQLSLLRKRFPLPQLPLADLQHPELIFTEGTSVDKDKLPEMKPSRLMDVSETENKYNLSETPVMTAGDKKQIVVSQDMDIDTVSDVCVLVEGGDSRPAISTLRTNSISAPPASNVNSMSDPIWPPVSFTQPFRNMQPPHMHSSTAKSQRNIDSK